MSKICELTGKKAITGHQVSFSNRKTKRKFNVNLKVKTFFIPETGETITLKVSTSALRNVTKNGIFACLKEAREKGYTTK
ncbi:MAG: 50S ribosomal protein L28 [Bacteroidia bacterium]